MTATAGVAAAVLATPVGAALRSRYDEPWRRYHDWSHVEALLAALAMAEADGSHWPTRSRRSASSCGTTRSTTRRRRRGATSD